MRKERLKEDIIHVRINKEEKEEASQILEALGTNLSAVISMMIRNIILYKGIPFDVVLPKEDNIKELLVEDSKVAETGDIALSVQEGNSQDSPNNDFSQQGMEGTAVSEQESPVMLIEDEDVFDTSDLDWMKELPGILSGEDLTSKEDCPQDKFSIMNLLD